VPPITPIALAADGGHSPSAVAAEVLRQQEETTTRQMSEAERLAVDQVKAPMTVPPEERGVADEGAMEMDNNGGHAPAAEEEMGTAEEDYCTTKEAEPLAANNKQSAPTDEIDDDARRTFPFGPTSTLLQPYQKDQLHHNIQSYQKEDED